MNCWLSWQNPRNTGAVFGKREWPLLHVVHLHWVWRELSLLNNEPQKGGRGDGELAFLGFDVQLIHQKLLYSQTNAPDMLLLGLRKDEYVIIIDKQESSVSCSSALTRA